MTTTSTITEEKIIIEDLCPWKVVFYNDDFTSFELVNFILINVFNKSEDEAMKITNQVHFEGRAVVDAFDYETAETKVQESTSLARMNNSPLKVTMEK